MKSLFIWNRSGLFAALFFASVAASALGQVRINEIMYHPPPAVPEDPRLEWMELFNAGTNAADLTGWRFTKGVAFTFTNVSLPAGGYLVVAANRTVFATNHPGVTNVVGDSTGKLSNAGETVELVDGHGQKVDSVAYFSSGDWALRRAGEIYAGQPSWWRGWQWTTPADGGGKSLELVNLALPNSSGQNWAASGPDGGTPGQANSAATNNSPPLVLDVQHLPLIPRATNTVTVTARVVDEAPAGVSVAVFYRVDGAPGFTAVAMFDDGAHGDGSANDGIFGAVLPARPDKTVVEFYVQATDAGGRSRTWPAPTDDIGTQGANALYQVDESTYAGTQPVYRLIVTAAESNAWFNLMDSVSNGRYANAEMNGTVVRVSGVGTEARYNAGIRNRGAGSRAAHPHNLHFGLPDDRPLHGITGLDFNTRDVHSQVGGNALFSLAGLPNAYGAPVQVRLNAHNFANASPTSGDNETFQFGSYFCFEPYGRDWAAAHEPQDPSGNIYKGTWYLDNVSLTSGANLDYRGTNVANYRQAYSPTGPTAGTGPYSKQSNTSEDDWSDLINLTAVLNNTPDSNFVQAVSQVADIDQWLRYFAANALIINMETTLGTGAGDDYSVYRGMTDPRFQLLNHDLDTVLGQGDTGPDYARSIFKAADIPTISHFLKHPAIAPRYFAALKQMADTVFAPAPLGVALDQALGGWVPNSYIQSMKNVAATRRAAVLSQIPLALSAGSNLALSNGCFRTTSPTVTLFGQANAITTRRLLVSGAAAPWSAWEGRWTNSVALVPGLNRVLVQALDATGQECERASVDVWYDKGTGTTVAGGTLAGNTTWSAAGGPYRVTGNLTIPAGLSLTIQPGTTIYFDSGVSLIINGQLLAPGTELQRLRFTRTPGVTGYWGGFSFTNARQSNVLAYADFEWAGSAAQAVYIKNSQVLIDRMTFLNNNPTAKWFDVWQPQVTIRHSVFGDLGAQYFCTAENMLADGWFVIDGNLFGKDTGDNDIFHLNRVSVKGGAAAVVVNNVFTGAGDDIVDDNESDTHIEGNLLMHANELASGNHGVSAAVTTGPGGSLGVPNMLNQHLTVVRNVFYKNDAAIISKTGAYSQIYNNVFVENNAAIMFDEMDRTDAGPGRQAYIESCIFWNNKPESVTNGTFVALNDLLAFATGRLSQGQPQVTVNNCILPAQFHSLGTNNLEADPRFVLPANLADLSPTNKAFSTGFDGFDSSPFLLAGGLIPDLRLRTNSPARGTGFNGVDMGAFISPDATIAGMPPSPTGQTNTTLTVGGTDLYGYKYRVLGPGLAGVWSDEKAQMKPAWQITLAGTTATATVTNHGYANGEVIEMLGADALTPYFNGFFTIANVTANTFDYTVTPGTNAVLNQTQPRDLWCKQPEPIHLTGLANGAYRVEVIRKNSQGVWQDTNTPTVAAWTVDTGLSGVVLNEVLADNQNTYFENDTTPDVIELHNPGAQPADLAGMRLTDDASNPAKFVFPPGATIAGGQYLLVIAGTGAGPNLHTGFKLTKTGGALQLFASPAAGGALLDAVTFGQQLTDLSIGRLPGGRWGLTRPTLGSANVPAPVGEASRLFINEWLAAPVATPDFVELYNSDPLPVNFGGCYLTDSPVNWPTRNPFPPLSFIPGNGLMAFIADGQAGLGADHLNFQLAQEWGALGLFAPDLTLIDRVLYGPQTAGISMGRAPNGSAQITFFPSPTPGAGNPGGTGPCTVTNLTLSLMTYAQGWKYNQSNNLDSVAWYAPNYNDAAWQGPGSGLLAFENNSLITPLIHTTLLDPHNVKSPAESAYYFRTTLVLSNDLTGFTVTASARIDDGAILYVNGVELPTRIRMNSGPVAFTTFANAQPPGGDATADDLITIPASYFVPGTNVIAAEVHQVNSSSSDIVWGLALDATRSFTNCPQIVVVLNEVMAHNLSLTNADGTVTDWVELYNPSADPTPLAGMSLADGVIPPHRWVFPTGAALAAGGRLVVRCDPSAPASAANGPVLNTGFGLGAQGGGVYLYDASGSLFDSVLYGPQAADFSIGRVPDGSTPWALTLPSPGSVNIAASLGDLGSVRINEWAASVANGPDWFELYNPNLQPVALGGLYLTDKLNNRTKQLIAPLTFLGVGADGYGVFTADNDPSQGPSHVNFTLDANPGEALGLFPAGTAPAIDSVTFGPQTTDVSEGRFPDGASSRVFFKTPTPGTANWLPLTNVVINEVLSHTDPPLEDAVELYNPGDAAVDLSGWYLSDAERALRKFRIPAGTVVPAHGYQTFYQHQFDPQPGTAGSFQFSSAKGESVWLTAVDANGLATGYRATESFGPQFNGVSFGRFPTSVGSDFTGMSALTFGTTVTAQSPTNQLALFRTGAGAANAYPRVGPVVISRIMYRPPPLGTNDNVQDEFLELHNISGGAVPLYDTLHPTNGWRLRAAVDFDFTTNHVMPAGDYLVVVSFNPAADTVALAAFRAKYGTNGAVVGPWSGKLANGGEAVELQAPDKPEVSGPDAGFVPYVTVERIVYSNTLPWPAGADGTGLVLQRVNVAAYGNDPANWTAAVPAIGTSGLADTDGDGMPDAWEDANGLNKYVNDANLDPDHDGFSNLQEYLAGTNPQSATSYLRLDSVIPAAGGAEIHFRAAAGRTYSVLYRDGLNTGTWQKLADVPEQPVTQDVAVPDSAGLGSSERYYRLVTPANP